VQKSSSKHTGPVRKTRVRSIAKASRSQIKHQSLAWFANAAIQT
jgi:hypothetical protein